jgi:hypothetical protein
MSIVGGRLGGYVTIDINKQPPWPRENHKITGGMHVDPRNALSNLVFSALCLNFGVSSAT